MLGLGTTGRVRASAAASSPQCRDIYQRYAATLYRQALLTHHDSALAEQVVCDVIVNECALALLPEHGEDDVRYRRQGRSSGAVSNFARRFKAHYGLSATTYRKRFATRAAHLHHPPRQSPDRPGSGRLR